VSSFIPFQKGVKAILACFPWRQSLAAGVIAALAVALPVGLYVFAISSGARWTADLAERPILEFVASGSRLTVAIRNRGSRPGRLARIGGLLTDGKCLRSDDIGPDAWQSKKRRLEDMIAAHLMPAVTDSRESGVGNGAATGDLPAIGTVLPAGGQISLFQIAESPSSTSDVAKTRFVAAAFEIPINVEMCDIDGRHCTRLMHSFTCDWLPFNSVYAP
jgi:hypothetical protein